jgi:hypothetical protein
MLLPSATSYLAPYARIYDSWNAGKIAAGGWSVGCDPGGAV